VVSRPIGIARRLKRPLEETVLIRKRLKDGLRTCGLIMRAIGLWLLLPLLIRRSHPFDPDTVRRIAVIRLDRLSDLVLTLPLLAALKRRWPSAEITLLCREAVAPLAQPQPEIDRLMTIRGMSGHLGGRAGRLLDRDERLRLRAWLQAEQFDLVIDPSIGDDLETALLAWHSRARYRLGFSTAGRGLLFTHAVEARADESCLRQQQALAAAIGIELDPDARPRLMVTPIERDTALARLRREGLDPSRPIIGIHPGGYDPAQRWPLGRFLQLAGRLEREGGWQVAFFGTRAEERLIAQIGMDAGQRVAVFFGLELREFIALIHCCSMMVCNNSGPLHLATGLGLPTVSTMGPTDPIRWRPVGQGHLVIRKPLWCSPCGEALCPLGTHACMTAISVEEMRAAVDEQMAALHRPGASAPRERREATAV
jgi:lipopolysaccharide heptosyltransferase II